MTDERFQELLEDYTDGTIDEAGSCELMGAFAKDPELKQRFIGELRVANSLHGIQALESQDQMTGNVLESIRFAKDAPDVSSAVIAELKSEEKVVPFPFMRVGLAIAAAVAVVFAVLTKQPQVDALATLANATDARWADDQDFSENDALPAGVLRLEAGVARIDFKTGVRVTLEGPAELELLSKTEVRLHSGILAAHVPPAGVGFQVYTEKVDVTDLGTTFGVSVTSDGSTDVEVFEGKVEVAPPVGDASGVVKREIILEGDAIKVPGDASQTKRRRIKPRSFRGWPVLFGVVNTGGRIKFINAQPISNPSEVTDRENIIVFPERVGFRSKIDPNVSFTEPGEYSWRDLKGVKRSLTLTNRRAQTYLLQFNPEYVETAARSDQVMFEGSVTFDGRVIGVIVDSELLVMSDGALGKKRFEYSNRPGRGLEHGDSVRLSEDRHTLGISWMVMQSLPRGMDQIRVIVETKTPSEHSQL